MHQLIITIQNQITAQEKQQKDWRGSVVTQWWQYGYWFDSASKCPQFLQKRELVSHHHNINTQL